MLKLAALFDVLCQGVFAYFISYYPLLTSCATEACANLHKNRRCTLNDLGFLYTFRWNSPSFEFFAFLNIKRKARAQNAYVVVIILRIFCFFPAKINNDIV